MPAKRRLSKNRRQKAPLAQGWTASALGDRIRARRVELNLTQTNLAAALDVSGNQIAKYEQGQDRIPVSTLMNIATALSTDIWYFFEGLHNPILPVPEKSLGPTELLVLLNRIRNPKHRAHLLKLARVLADARKSSSEATTQPENVS
jgi:transcriptional regulator with XRE-family HTH domain